MADRPAGEVGVVAVLAQVGEEDVPEVFGGDFGDELRSGLIREVAVAREDALFHRPGALGVVLKKGFVVVRFDHERVDATDRVEDLAGGIAKVGEDPKGGIGAGNDEAQGVGGVMRHGEGVDAEFPDLKSRAAVEKTPLGVDGALAEAFGGEGIGKNGNPVFGAKHLEAAGVVAVLVGEQDAG